MKQPVAIISAGYWFQIAVPLEKLSETVKLLTNAEQVDSKYIDNKQVFYRKSKRQLTIEIVDSVLDEEPVDPAKQEEIAA